MIDLPWVQDMCYALLMSAPQIRAVNIVRERTLLANATVEMDTIWMAVRNGRSGNGILIEEVEARINSPSTGAQDLICKFVCFQNGDAAFTPETGGGFFAQNLAQVVLDLLNKQCIGGLGTLQGVDVAAAKDYPWINASRATLRIVGANNLSTPRCAQISNINNAGVVALACTTPGSTIYYTLDGSPPCDPELKETIADVNGVFAPINPNAKVYTAPFAVSNGDRLFAVAHAPGFNPSEIAYTKIA